MRLRRTQSALIKLGVKYTYKEKDSLGKIFIGSKRIYEHYINGRRKTINIMAEEINMTSEDQLIAWIENNHDRLI